MLQPFVKFKTEFIDRLIGMNKKYLISQSYKRGFNHLEEVHKTDILFSDYDDLGLATIHYDALKNDQYRSLIHLTETKHRSKVEEMLSPSSQYNVYWAVVTNKEEVQRRLDFNYKANIRNYIQDKTNWRVRADEEIKTTLQVIYGELFLIIKRSNQSIRIKFDEIEKA